MGKPTGSCRKKESHGCKGAIILDSLNIVLSSAEHNHVANANETIAEDAKAALRERARKSLTNLDNSAIYERLFRGIRDELEAMAFRFDLDEGPKPKNIVKECGEPPIML
ncbi:hypothetical protein RvY_06145 [Ramazzottius varieornatus]|uniref:FLYWCH-type domain-containing protein n=1 Tax=Ramazzottius varieornatus TaxID=947166 RepID=A0A1D1UXJ5_RAMVA|nr:hypothetical protein RvY_06145 [Ramazzottius varieornatus]